MSPLVRQYLFGETGSRRTIYAMKASWQSVQEEICVCHDVSDAMNSEQVKIVPDECRRWTSVSNCATIHIRMFPTHTRSSEVELQIPPDQD